MRRLWMFVFASLGVGCSLITKFDQDGQPCDKTERNPAQSCLSDAGYTCVSGFCKKGPGSGADGGVDAGIDGGLDGG